MSANRHTKYTKAVTEVLRQKGHATNAELLQDLRCEYPELSSTTVHRITSRMIERGEVQLAPSGKGNVRRFDANIQAHDHFVCEICDMLRDAQLGQIIRPAIETAIGDNCSISGSLTVAGVCKNCAKITKEV